MILYCAKKVEPTRPYVWLIGLSLLSYLVQLRQRQTQTKSFIHLHVQVFPAPWSGAWCSLTRHLHQLTAKPAVISTITPALNLRLKRAAEHHHLARPIIRPTVHQVRERPLTGNHDTGLGYKAHLLRQLSHTISRHLFTA